jgi:hypothetical protein
MVKRSLTSCKASERLEEFTTLSPDMEPKAMNASSLFPDNGFHTVVEVLENGGEWYVRVAEAGNQIIRTFGVESRAIDFAAEQCLRLGLEKYDRV